MDMVYAKSLSVVYKFPLEVLTLKPFTLISGAVEGKKIEGTKVNIYA